MLFALSILFHSSLASAEIPAVGNFAKLTYLEVSSGSSKFGNLTHKLLNYDKSTDEFTIEQLDSQSSQKRQWRAARDNLSNAEDLRLRLTTCTERGGEFIPAFKVRAGTFPSCKYKFENREGSGEYFAGVVPFGLLAYRFRTQSGKMIQYELSEFKE